MAKKSNASILKAKGLIPKSWDLRKLTDYKRRIISKRSREYAEVIKYPDKFKSRTYSKAKADKLLDAGYSGVGRNILIPNRGNTTVATHVEGDKVIIDRGNRIETVYLNTGKDFLNKVRRMMEREQRMAEEGEEYDKETYWAFKVGDNNTFLNVHGSLESLMHYGQTLNLTDPKAKNFVHLVKVEYKEGHRAINQLPHLPGPADSPLIRKKPKKWVNKRGK